jgi:hypothetical protein
MAEWRSRCAWGVASGWMVLCLASCEGEHRPYPNFIQQGDAASNVAPEHAEPALTPAPGASGSETIGEGARLPSPDTSTNGTSSSTPNLDVSKPAADAGARATPDGCDCSNSPAAPLCKITANGSAAQTCVECLSNADCLNVAAPRCDEQTGRCAACQSNTDCDRFSGKPYCIDSVDARCVECANDTHCADNPSGARCNMATNACVECVVDADCASPGASRCADNHCQPCANDSGGSHCGHIVRGTSVLGVCDTSGASGLCVQCTGTQSAVCGANVCGSLSKLCTARPAGTRSECSECVSDAECQVGLRCARGAFGAVDLGYSCYPLEQNGACPDSLFVVATRVTTIDGAVESLCMPRVTTCTAFLQSTQPCITNEDCGEVNLDDGRCSPSGICSLPCVSSIDCLSGSPSSGCTDGVCVF